MTKKALTKKTKLMLFALGEYYRETNKKIRLKSLQAVISKADFIRLVKNAGITSKGARAIYKNLEVLEKKKYVKYDNRELMFTKKGVGVFTKIEKEINPYLDILKTVKKSNVSRHTRKTQTVFV